MKAFLIRSVQVLCVALELSFAGDAARVYMLENSAERVVPYDESTAIQDVMSNKFDDVAGLDRWTSKVFSCFRPVHDERKRIQDVRLMWSDGERVLLVDRFAMGAKMVSLKGNGETACGTFDAIAFERLLRNDKPLWALVLEHTQMGDLFPGTRGWRVEWLKVCWLIVENRLNARISLSQFGVSVSSGPGETTGTLMPDEDGRVSVELPLLLLGATIRQKVYSASELPEKWASRYRPPAGFNRVRIIAVDGSVADGRIEQVPRVTFGDAAVSHEKARAASDGSLVALGGTFAVIAVLVAGTIWYRATHRCV